MRYEMKEGFRNKGHAHKSKKDYSRSNVADLLNEANDALLDRGFNFRINPDINAYTWEDKPLTSDDEEIIRKIIKLTSKGAT